MRKPRPASHLVPLAIADKIINNLHSASHFARIAQLVKHFHGKEAGTAKIAVAVGPDFGSLEPLEA
jgi:hypothetical protein